MQTQKKDRRWKDWQENRRHGALPPKSYEQRASPRPGICGDDQDRVLADIIYDRPVSNAERERYSQERLRTRAHVDPRGGANRTTLVRGYQQNSSPRPLRSLSTPESGCPAGRVSPRDDPGRTVAARPFVWYEEVQVPQRHAAFDSRPAGRPSPREGSARATAATLADQVMKLHAKSGRMPDSASATVSTSATWWGGWSSRSSEAMSARLFDRSCGAPIVSPPARPRRGARVEEKTHQHASPENVLANPICTWGAWENGADAAAGGGTAAAVKGGGGCGGICQPPGAPPGAPPPPSVQLHRESSAASVASSCGSVRAPSAASAGPTPGSARLSTRMLQDHEASFSSSVSSLAAGFGPVVGACAGGGAPAAIADDGTSGGRGRGAGGGCASGAEKPSRVAIPAMAVSSVRGASSVPVAAPRSARFVPSAFPRSTSCRSVCSDGEVNAGRHCSLGPAALLSGGPPPRAFQHFHGPGQHQTAPARDAGAVGLPLPPPSAAPSAAQSRGGSSHTTLMRGSSSPLFGGRWGGASERSPLHPHGRRHLRSGECAPTHVTFEALFPERVLFPERMFSPERT